MPPWHHKRVQRRHWVPISDSKSKGVRRYYAVCGKFAEDAACLPLIELLANRPEILVVASALVRVAFEAALSD